MDEKLKVLEENRQKTHKNVIIINVIGVFMIVVGIILAYFLQVFELLFFGIFVSVIFFVVAAIYSRGYTKKAKRDILEVLIKQTLGENAFYDEHRGIDLSEILSQGLYQRPDRYHLEDYISCTYNDVFYEMCDVILEEKHVTRDSKGNRRVTYEKYFQGRVIRIDFKRDITFKMKIIEGNPRGLNVYGLEKMETEVIEFNKKFKTYVSDKNEAFYYLTPLLILKMVELEKLFKGSIQYTMDGDHFYIFINNSTDFLEVSLSKKLSGETLNILASQLRLGETIINEFDLDKRKFNQNIEM